MAAWRKEETGKALDGFINVAAELIVYEPMIPYTFNPKQSLLWRPPYAVATKRFWDLAGGLLDPITITDKCRMIVTQTWKPVPFSRALHRVAPPGETDWRLVLLKMARDELDGALRTDRSNYVLVGDDWWLEFRYNWKHRRWGIDLVRSKDHANVPVGTRFITHYDTGKHLPTVSTGTLT